MGPDTQIAIRQFDDTTLHGPWAELPPNVVHVWKRSLPELASVEIDASYDLLSPDERERAARYRVEQPRSDFILTRGALRSLLAAYLQTASKDLSFNYSEFGKPRLNGECDLHFNVSHTNGLAMLAFVRRREVGIDVERIRPAMDAKKLAERYFSVRERQSLANLSGDELNFAFFRCWTRKEAFIKGRGDGLSLPLHQFDVSVESDESNALLATRPDPSEAGHWIVRDLTASPGYAAALAVARGTG